MTSAEFRELALVTLMADCLLMQLGSNLHWGQTCKFCIRMQLNLQTCTGIKLTNLQSQCPDRDLGADSVIRVLGGVDGSRAPYMDHARRTATECGLLAGLVLVEDRHQLAELLLHLHVRCEQLLVAHPQPCQWLGSVRGCSYRRSRSQCCGAACATWSAAAAAGDAAWPSSDG